MITFNRRIIIFYQTIHFIFTRVLRESAPLQRWWQLSKMLKCGKIFVIFHEFCLPLRLSGWHTLSSLHSICFRDYPIPKIIARFIIFKHFRNKWKRAAASEQLWVARTSFILGSSASALVISLENYAWMTKRAIVADGRGQWSNTMQQSGDTKCEQHSFIHDIHSGMPTLTVVCQRCSSSLQCFAHIIHRRAPQLLLLYYCWPAIRTRNNFQLHALN